MAARHITGAFLGFSTEEYNHVAAVRGYVETLAARVVCVYC